MRAPPLTFRRARSLRHQLSLPEVILWQALRASRFNGLRFRRQHPIGPYILDFFCPAARIAVEIDGASHNHPERASHDVARDRWLTDKSIRVLRFAAVDVLKDRALADVLATIAQATAPSVGFADSSPASGGASPSSSLATGAAHLRSSRATRGRRTKRSMVEGAE
jgi:very-short-patch-repair endonuclease